MNTKTTLQHTVENVSLHSGARKYKLNRFTPHCVVGQCTAAGIASIFKNREKKYKAAATQEERNRNSSSCNYGIGKDGDLVEIVPEGFRSWCSSSSDNDNRAITVEVASGNADPYEFTQAAYEELIRLAVDIGIRYGFKRFIWIPDKAKALAYQPAADECLITVHRWFAAKSCPGDWLYSRLGEFAAEVTRRIAAETEPPAGLHHTPSPWAADAWEWAKSTGITDGTNPSGPATREMVAAMIYRVMNS
ncbi:peptidoglycan recognition family protein [uncultured Alistipes sp.]|uniref:peptidoglycan recognition protein family protein n=1 Tax=uncultured Alistipes sp. TaxID=538949 RepID=UPI002626D80C|nr:peptidoglycan recognition family protein [uncultured Alistipes sp.]